MREHPAPSPPPHPAPSPTAPSPPHPAPLPPPVLAIRGGYGTTETLALAGVLAAAVTGCTAVLHYVSKQGEDRKRRGR
jgi:hypothetical protein